MTKRQSTTVMVLPLLADAPTMLLNSGYPIGTGSTGGSAPAAVLARLPLGESRIWSLNHRGQDGSFPRAPPCGVRVVLCTRGAVAVALGGQVDCAAHAFWRQG